MIAELRAKYDFGHPDWIMAAMWWVGAIFVLFVAWNLIGFLALVLVASIRTYVTMDMSRRKTEDQDESLS